LLRLQLGLTQEQLVEGIATKSTLSQIESGKTLASVELLLQIADRLHIGIDELLDNFPLNRKPADVAKIAAHLFQKGSYAAALLFFHKWQEIESDNSNDPAVMLKIGICHAETGDIERAIILLETVQQLAAMKGDCVTRYQSLDHLGKIYYDAGNFHLAQHYWVRALERTAAAAELDGELIWRLHNRIGVAYFELGEHETAIDHFYRGMEWIQEEAYMSQRAISMINVASCLKYLQQYERAGEMFRMLRQEETELEPLLYSIIRLHYGVYLAATGRLSEALMPLQEARQEFVKVNEVACVRQVDNELADVYRRIGEFDKSKQILEQLLGQLTNQDIEYAQAKRIMGLLHSDIGNYEAALLCLQQALQLFEAQGRTGEVKVMQDIIAENLTRNTDHGIQYRS
jgi:tetratricopeptide (TPR) repeat protein